MIVDNIRDFIKNYEEEYYGQNVCELKFSDKKLYGELLDYCLDNGNNYDLYRMIRDIYQYRLKTINTDETKAYNYFLKEYSLNKGNECKTKIGELYLYGIVLPKNYEKALKWFLIDEGRRSPNTLHFLGYMYYNGLGTECNYNKAFEYFKESSKGNYGESYRWLGYCYFYGHGVEQDYKKGYRYFQLANYSFVRDNSDVRYHLGLCNEYGYGTEQNFYNAIDLYYWAARNNHDAAIKKLREYKFGVKNEFNVIDLEDGEYRILNEIISDGEIVFLPDVTHIGYEFTLIKEANVEGDYHHFKTLYNSAEYEQREISIKISKNIKKIILKNETSISKKAKKCLEEIVIEIRK